MCLFSARPTDAECREIVRNIEEACRAYSTAAREGVAERWWKIDPPDYACGGVEVGQVEIPVIEPIMHAEPMLDIDAVMLEINDAIVRSVALPPQYLVTRHGWTSLIPNRYMPRQPEKPDLLAAIRDIARGS